MNKIAIWVATSAAILAPLPVHGENSVSTLPIREKERAALFPSRADIEEGKTLAESACAACHGLDGVSSEESRPHLAGQRTVYLYREILAYKNGARSDESMHRAVEFLSDEALLSTAIYFASLAPPDSSFSREEAQLIDEQIKADPLDSARKATIGCAGCHGADGNSTIPGMPNLTAQDPEYFVLATRAYQGHGVARSHSMMETLAAPFDEEALRRIGIYYALQQPKRTTAEISGDPNAAETAAEACGTCHGADGNATAPDTPTIAGQDPVYLIMAMKDYRTGARDHTAMVSAMTGVDDAMINNLAAFYARQEPVARQVRKPLTTAEWLERCDRCHGIDGNSRDPRYAALAGQNEAYLLKVLKAYAYWERNDSMMHAMADPLSKEDVKRLAAFYASREPRSVVYFELPCKGTEE